jgi:hypothetical protein
VAKIRRRDQAPRYHENVRGARGLGTWVMISEMVEISGLSQATWYRRIAAGYPSRVVSGYKEIWLPIGPVERYVCDYTRNVIAASNLEVFKELHNITTTLAKVAEEVLGKDVADTLLEVSEIMEDLPCRPFIDVNIVNSPDSEEGEDSE